MGWKRNYIESTLFRVAIITFLFIVIAKGAIEDGGDPATYGWVAITPGSIYLAIKLVTMRKP